MTLYMIKNIDVVSVMETDTNYLVIPKCLLCDNDKFRTVLHTRDLTIALFCGNDEFSFRNATTDITGMLTIYSHLDIIKQVNWVTKLYAMKAITKRVYLDAMNILEEWKGIN